MQRKLYTLIVTAVMIAVSLVGCAWGSVSLSAFPDPVFREYLKRYDYGWTEYDSKGESYRVGKDDGILGDKEIERITTINDVGREISSLKGIEYLTALTSLCCESNQITTLDVSKNIALTSLNCAGNQLTALDLSKNTALTWLHCGGNELTELDVSHNIALTCLDCNDNQLTALDVSNNTALTVLNCSHNQLTELDLSNNTALLPDYTGHSAVDYCNQKRSGLKVKKTSEGYYEVDMKDYVSQLENIDADLIYGNESWIKPLSYDKEMGIITFNKPITELRYGYMTHVQNVHLTLWTLQSPIP